MLTGNMHTQYVEKSSSKQNIVSIMNNKHEEETDESIHEDEDEKVDANLVQCPICLRKMRSDVFVKHPNVCRQNPTKKRNINVFDMSKYRSIRSGDKVLPVRKVSPSNTNKSNCIRPSQTRSTKRDRRTDAFVPPIINNFSCPHCKRTFCEKAYDRHVTFCSSKSKQLQQPPSEEKLLAQLKLDRRIKFGANRFASTTPAVNTGQEEQMIASPGISNQTIKENSTPPIEAFCFLSIRKTHSDKLARCPWCSKPYLPNCIHYCRHSKELFSIHSK